MSKLAYLERELGYLGIPLIVGPEQFRLYWEMYRYIERSRRLLTPEIRDFCEKEVVEKILFEDNEYLGIVLHQSLKDIISYLNAKSKNFRLGVYLYRNRDMLGWEGLTILINVDYKNFDEKLSLWKDIENRITKTLEGLKEEHPEESEKIQKANEIIATTIQRLVE